MTRVGGLAMLRGMANAGRCSTGTARAWWNLPGGPAPRPTVLFLAFLPACYLSSPADPTAAPESGVVQSSEVGNAGFFSDPRPAPSAGSPAELQPPLDAGAQGGLDASPDRFDAGHALLDGALPVDSGTLCVPVGRDAALSNEEDAGFAGQLRGRVRRGEGGEVAGPGALDDALVTRMIKTRIRGVQACYERELGAKPTLAGALAVRFTVAPRGDVSAVEVVANESCDAALAECVLSAVRRFRFNPGPVGGAVTYQYRFIFSPQQ